jgi:hypothetical protein
MSRLRHSVVTVRLAFAASITAEITATETASADPDRNHAIYAELLGKGGLWGLGYDYRLDGRFSLGGVASFFVLESQRVATVSPYVGILIGHRGPHAWFAHAGPQLSRSWAPSPVPEWSGEVENGIGGELSSGYEYRARFLTRVFGQGVVGEGGIVPWLGVSLGWEF